MKESDLQEITSQQSFINYCFNTNSKDIAYWENWLKENPEHRQEIAEIKTSILLLPYPASEKVIQHDFQRLKNSIAANQNQQQQTKNSTIKLWTAISGMVAAIAIIIIGSYIYKTKLQTKQINENIFVNDVAPGTQGATLTLANGKKIQLSTATTGQLATESGVTITKTATGELIYKIQDNSGSELLTNTLSTARGETYQVLLPDGSKVWLNAASELKYPAKFIANQRIVQLNGEAYFEIAKDKAHPFVVETARQDVEVLGTHFNVSSYANESAAKTTLIEGSVAVNGTITLVPGEEASTSADRKTSISQVDVDKAVAWKNDKFVFQDEDIQSVMRKLARWYNVEVIYQGDLPKKTFLGTISRYDNISKILEKITFTQAVHFKIEGRRVTVMP